MRKNTILLLILLLFCALLTGCHNTEDISKKIIGNWRMSDDSFETIVPDPVENYTFFDWIYSFREDGTGTVNIFGLKPISFVYKVEKDNVSTKITDSSDEWNSAKVKFSGDILTLTNENGTQVLNKVSQEYVDSIKYLKDDLKYAENIVGEIFEEYISANNKNEDINTTVRELKIFDETEEKELNYDLGRNELIVKITYDVGNIGEDDIDYLKENNIINGEYDLDTGYYKNNTVVWIVRPLIYKYGITDITKSYLGLENDA